VRTLRLHPTYLHTWIYSHDVTGRKKNEIPQALLSRVYAKRKGPQIWPTSKLPVNSPKGAPEKLFYEYLTVGDMIVLVVVGI